MKEADGTTAADDLEEDEVAMVGEEDEVVMEEEKETDNAEEIVVEYNHNDYADLIGDGNTISKTDEVVEIAGTPSTSAVPVQNMGNRPLPKRPGAMPPFALFSQEMRTKLQT